MEKYKDKSLNIEERIDDLLSKMTNEEKVGQMLQVSDNTLSKEDYESTKISVSAHSCTFWVMRQTI